ncbi:hypothetical protein [Haliscomenobacter sp.]|uniref:hypothetical protein n=1 Tax=Haliscomenobacter sp. TaxID=2717303 RepID=UPI003364FC70
MKQQGLILWSLILLVSLFVMSGCQSDYEKMRNRELASGIRHDSLFFGFYMGMPNQDFFAHCLKLNRQRILTNDGGGRKVKCYLKNTEPRIAMTFYPNFKDGKIREIPVEFYYETWAPWNKEYWSEKLLPRVLGVLEKWYGKGFIKVEDKEKGTIYVKVDGNRQIVVGIKNDQQVKANFTDLLNPMNPNEIENPAAMPKTTSKTTR